MKKRTIHLLPNAHIDPVWLWNWREGVAEAISTCRSIVTLMRENPDLTFIRGEAWFYEQIQEFSPQLFSEVRELVDSGRWDIVGGGYIQSDTNLPDTTAFLHQFETGRDYFQQQFGRRVEACWSADSFGQSWGMVEIYAAAGLKYYAFGRPESWIFPLPRPLFYWIGPGGSRLLSYRIPLDWYAIERDGMQRRLDDYAAHLAEWDLENTALFFGLGDHGGGPSRRHIEEIRRWSDAHPELEVKFSTLHNFFHAAEAEIAARGADLQLPVIESEINFAQRGYFANCQKIKFPYRRAEAAMKRASLVQNGTAAFLHGDAPDLKKEWQDLSFNAFHDILPGTCIESAAEEQKNWIGGITHAAVKAEFQALEQLVARMDTTVPEPAAPDAPEAVPVVVFNPLPYAYHGPVEFEAALDSRPLWNYQGRGSELPVELLDESGRPVFFQRLDEEHNSFKTIPWRQRVIFQGEIPPFGWRKYTLGYRENPSTAAAPAGKGASVSGENILENQFCRVVLNPETSALEIYREGAELFGGAGLAFETVPDTWGSWGCQKETPDAFMCRGTPERWRLSRSAVLEQGPERATLFAEFRGEHSRILVQIQLCRSRPAVDFDLRILWNETGTRLRLVTRRAESVTYAIPGGELERTRLGDVPGGRYLLVHYPEKTLGFINDTLCGFGNYENCFGITLIRGSRFCTELPMEPEQAPQRQPADLGEHHCHLSLVLNPADCRRLAEEMELPPLPLICDRHPGVLPGVHSLFKEFPAGVKLLDLRLDERRELIAVVQQFSGAEQEAVFQFAGREAVTRKIPHGKIVEVRLG